MSSIALVDCNNFFVSCERVFNPKLHNRPVCILSSNDGCIIARSAEAKALGIPMGAPLFAWRDFCERHGVLLLSSNFTLYGDLSRRVMEILREKSAAIEVYSIDEAFVEIEDPHAVRAQILQWTGIPVSIGVAQTKTLAKVASCIAKKRSSGVCTDPLPYLDAFAVEDVWGIGRRLAQRLAKKGIFTVGQLLKLDERRFAVPFRRTIWELRGMRCRSLSEEHISKQSITTSRTFGVVITEERQLCEAIAAYAARAGEKVREERSVASWLELFWRTEKGTFSQNVTFSRPTDYTPELTAYALSCLRFEKGERYKKAGIVLGGLHPQGEVQGDLFSKPLAEKKRIAQATMDQINGSMGSEALFFARAGTKREWKTRRDLCSPCYTTEWDAILTINI